MVVAEHTACSSFHGHLSHIGQQVVRNMGSSPMRPVGADGIEVAQQHDVPPVVARVAGSEKDLLEHRFAQP